jgi:hypothetical protein
VYQTTQRKAARPFFDAPAGEGGSITIPLPAAQKNGDEVLTYV